MRKILLLLKGTAKTAETANTRFRRFWQFMGRGGDVWEVA
jgi:hypothetical protein